MSKKKCIIIGNCQHTRLELLLSGKLLKYYGISSQTTNFSKKFDIIYTKDIHMRDRKTLNKENISSADLIITQQISNNFGDLSTENLLKYKKDSCSVIRIPNFYFRYPFFNYESSKVIRPNKLLSSTIFGGFPEVDKFFIDYIISLTNEQNSQYFLDEILPSKINNQQLQNDLQIELKNMCQRENTFNLDIKCIEYLYNLINGKYIDELKSTIQDSSLLMGGGIGRTLKPIAINHPSTHYFLWLIKEIYNKLNLVYDKEFDYLLKYNLFNSSPETPSLFDFEKPLINQEISETSKNKITFNYPGTQGLSLVEYYNNIFLYSTGKGFSYEPSVSNKFLESMMYGHRQLLPCYLTEQFIEKRLNKKIKYKIINSMYDTYHVPIIYKDGNFNFIKAPLDTNISNFKFKGNNCSIYYHKNGTIYKCESHFDLNRNRYKLNTIRPKNCLFFSKKSNKSKTSITFFNIKKFLLNSK